MELEIMPYDLTVCKVAEMGDIPSDIGFFFMARTDEEISLVCKTEDVPENVLCREDDWRAFRIKGVLDFSLTGILAQISGVLAKRDISIFAVSTYNTDYILVRSFDLEKAVKVLKAEGYKTDMI